MQGEPSNDLMQLLEMLDEFSDVVALVEIRVCRDDSLALGLKCALIQLDHDYNSYTQRIFKAFFEKTTHKATNNLRSLK